MIEPLTICCPYFKSLGLPNLDAALYSVRQQDLARVAELIVVDNDTPDPVAAIQAVVDAHAWPMPTRVRSIKHGDPTRTHAWSSNVAIGAVTTPWLLMTRADYLLDPTCLQQALAIVEALPDDWDGFVTSHGCHVTGDLESCEATAWRRRGPRVLRGVRFTYTAIDTGVFLVRRSAWARVGGLDESFTAWGHAQTDFQARLHATGTQFVVIPQTLFWHPAHAAPRDLALAHAQLRAKGLEPRALWARYEGVSPY